MKDTDRFIIRASGRWAEISHDRVPPLEVWGREIERIRTTFWDINDLSLEAFVRASHRRLSRVIPAQPLVAALRDFKREVESQHRKDFGDPPKEAVGQSLLSIFLNARGIRARKEVPSGAGRTDIFFPVDGPVIETKVPRSVTEYRDGLLELAQYVRNEGKESGVYVVFADRENPTHTKWLRESFEPFRERVEGVSVEVIPVDIGRTYPSEIGKRRRARKK